MFAQIPIADQSDQSAMAPRPKGGTIDELAESEAFWQPGRGIENDTVRIWVPPAPRAMNIPGTSAISRVKRKSRENRETVRDRPRRLLCNILDLGQVGRPLRLLVVFDRDKNFLPVPKKNMRVDPRVGRVTIIVDEIDARELFGEVHHVRMRRKIFVDASFLPGRAPELLHYAPSV